MTAQAGAQSAPLHQRLRESPWQTGAELFRKGLLAGSLIALGSWGTSGLEGIQHLWALRGAAHSEARQLAAVKHHHWVCWDGTSPYRISDPPNVQEGER